jgi:hypothetical protein
MAPDDRDRRDNDLDLEDPLGIAHEPVEPDPRIHSSNDPASVRRRRERALGPRSTERRTIVGESDDPQGAKGVDMGGGGDGTDVKPSR